VKGNLVASKKTRRLIALSAFAAAAAAPVIAATTISASEPENFQAGPACLAWFGNQEDGHCLSYSNGNGSSIGTPWGIYGPNNYGNNGLLPGQRYTGGVN
jgi:hypothetical protein